MGTENECIVCALTPEDCACGVRADSLAKTNDALRAENASLRSEVERLKEEGNGGCCDCVRMYEAELSSLKASVGELVEVFVKVVGALMEIHDRTCADICCTTTEALANEIGGVAGKALDNETMRIFKEALTKFQHTEKK